MKKQNKSYQICWWPFWRDLYGRYRNHHISYMMYQVANAVAMARRAEMREPPKFSLCRRAERAARW